MNFVMSSRGLLVHSREDWLCAVCRPKEVVESRGCCLCLGCAQAMMAAAGAGEEGARDLLDDITDALSLLETQQPTARLAAN